MNWFDTLNDKRSLESIYGAEIPDLDSVCIRELTLDENGPSLKIRFDFGKFPSNPPLKWAQSGFNTVQCVLVFDQLSSVQIHGWLTRNVGQLEIVQESPARFKVTFNGSSSKFWLDCGLIWLQTISAYTNN
ncbi:Imm50 family immunity protein [Oligoflexus tunisiensis]|uniref:Imm50 family immunity protein n=1 Tax=Oligoflexus tunisiensis TaxID=708132 RepID=UPI00114CDC74|nr:Imm50 family immunity protein [Oligoflexus tunisiensis]